MTAEPYFPKTLIEFQRRFSTEEACEAYLAECRWPDGFRCPRCGHDQSWAIAPRRTRECKQCHYQASLTAGTILHNTKTDLTVWFLAAYMMVIDKRGLSALYLQKRIGVKRYETAWMMLHKLRRAMVAANRTKLSGVVEVDEAWIGGQQKGMPGGRSRVGRRAALAVFAVESHDGRLIRLRIKLIPDDKAKTLIGFVQEVVEPGSTVITDGWKSYLTLPAHGYVHQRVIEGSGASFVNPVPAVHIAVGNLKTWLISTHKGVWPRHLGAYLDEFVFRYNRRRNLPLAFRTLLGIGTSRPPTSYDTINGAKDMPKIVYTPSNRVTGRGTGRPRGRPKKTQTAISSAS